MALKKKSGGRFWSRVHFFIRFLGLTGLLCFGVGVAIAYLDDILGQVFSKDPLSSWVYIRDVLSGETGDRTTIAAVVLLGVGALLAVFALAIEALAILVFAAGRRSAFGFHATVQVLLATALFLG